MVSIASAKAIRLALSEARLGTYEALIKPPTPKLDGALALYAWNAKVSAAMLAPLHICEVVIRNAVSDAISAVYGPQWPWSTVFEQSLPTPFNAFNARRELMRARDGQPSTGKVIAELNMMFWQKMFTGRFDNRIWNANLLLVMPHLDAAKSVSTLRSMIHGDLEQLRGLRNRIAHHEPIFTRVLNDDLTKINHLIAFRCPVTAAWMMNNQHASEILNRKP